MKLNLNDLAREVARLEGKKIQISIAQIKETMKCTFVLLGKAKNQEVIQVINRYRPKTKRVPYGK